MLTEKNIVSKNNLRIVIIGIITILMMLAFSLYRWYDIGFVPRMQLELYAELLFLFVLLERSLPKYTYELDQKVLRITKRGLFGLQSYEIPYENISGIYEYAPKLVSVVKFRCTYRLHSALDGRIVWTLIYEEQRASKKKDNKRIYFKASAAFLLALNEKLHNKVAIKEDIAMKKIIINQNMEVK